MTSISANTFNITTGNFKNITCTNLGGTSIASTSDITAATNKFKIVTPSSLANIFSSVGTIGFNNPALGVFNNVNANLIAGLAIADTKVTLAGTNNTKAINPFGARVALLNPPVIGSGTANSAQFQNIQTQNITESSSVLATISDVDGSQTGTFTPTYSWTVAGSAQMSNTKTKMGSTSLALLNSGDYIQTTFSIFPNEWTIEFWFNVTSFGSNNTLIGNMNEYRMAANYDSVNKKVNIFLSSNGSAWDIVFYESSTNTVEADTWNHFALQYNGFEYALYLNGVKTTLTLSSKDVNSSAWTSLRFGDWEWNTDYMNGYIDELRISNIARYTSSFTPSTTEFIRDPNTLVLNHFNGTNGSTNVDATEVTTMIGYAQNKIMSPYSFVNMLKTPPTIGSIAPNAATFTDLTINGYLTLVNPVTTVQGGLGRTSYAKGDLLVGGGGSSVNVLPVGGSNMYLRSSTQSTYGVDWQSAGQSINTNAKPLFASSTESLNVNITDKALPPNVIPYVASRSYPIGSVTPNTGNFGNVTVNNSLNISNSLTLAQGGTGITSYQTGDLIVGSGSNNGLSKLNTGTYGQYLKTDPTSSTGMLWATPSTGGGSSASITNNASLSNPKKVNNTTWSFNNVSVSNSTGDTFTKSNLVVDVSSANVNQNNGIMQSSTLGGTVTINSSDPYNVIGTSTTFTSTFRVGDVIYFNDFNAARQITAIASNTSLTIDSPVTQSVNTWTNRLALEQATATSRTAYRLNQGKFGGGAGYINSKDTMFKVDLGTNTLNTWTYELWYTHNSGGQSGSIFQIPGYFNLYRNSSSSDNVTFVITNGSNSVITSTNYNPSATGFVHMAICYDGSFYSVFINGGRQYISSSGQPNIPIYNLKQVLFGSIKSGGNISYIDEFRVSNIARYSTSTYPIPTSKYSWDSNTISLQHFESPDFNETDDANIVFGSTSYKRGGYSPNTRYSVYGFTDGSTSVSMLSTRDVTNGETVVDIPSGISSFTMIQLPIKVDVSSNIVSIVKNTELANDYVDIGYPKQINKTQYSIPYAVVKNSIGTDTIQVKQPTTISFHKTGPNGMLLDPVTGTLSSVSGTTVVGNNTQFRKEFKTGDIITINGQSRSITGISSDTSLTVGTAFTSVPSWSGKDNSLIGTVSPPSSSNALYLSNTTTRSQSVYVSGVSVPSGNWTIEIWLYPNLQTSTNYGILTNWLNNNAIQLVINSNFSITFNFATTNYTDASTPNNSINPSGLLTNNAWNHIALQYNGSSYKAIVNGDFTNAGNANVTNPIVSNIWDQLMIGGSNSSGTGTVGYEGYIGSFRISDTTRYSANFTPANTFTKDVNTLCLNTFNSTTSISSGEQVSGVVWTASVPVYSSIQKKYGTSSLEFKGGSNTTNIANSGVSAHMHSSINGLTNLHFAWTMELWVYINGIHKDYNCLLGTNRGSTDIFRFGMNRSGILSFYAITNNTYNPNVSTVSGSGTIQIDTGVWNHVALVFTGTSYNAYVNGALDFSIASESIVPDGVFRGLTIGKVLNNSSWSLTDAYIDEFRVSSVARYSGQSFTVPSSAFTKDMDTVVLNHFNFNDTVLDLNSSEEPVLVKSFPSGLDIYGNNVPIYSNSIYKFGSSSIDMQGGSQTLSLNNIQITDGPWTIECWHYPLSWQNTSRGLFKYVTQEQFGNGIIIALPVISNTNGGTSTISMGAGTVTLNTWSHFAFVFTGSQYLTFFNGFLVQTVNSSLIAVTSFWESGTIGPYDGYIDEYRISNIARYTASFSVQTAPYVSDRNTLMLYHADTAFTANIDTTNPVLTCDDFTQPDPINAPIYKSNGGYLNMPYFMFEYSKMANLASSYTFTPSITGGLTMAVFVRFARNPISTDYVINGNGNNNAVTLYRNGQGYMSANLNNGSVNINVTGSSRDFIYQNEWILFTLTYDFANKTFNIYKNGNLCISAYNATAMNTCDLGNICLGNGGNIDISRFYAYNSLLSLADINSINNSIRNNTSITISASPVISLNAANYQLTNYEVLTSWPTTASNATNSTPENLPLAVSLSGGQKYVSLSSSRLQYMTFNGTFSMSGSSGITVLVKLFKRYDSGISTLYRLGGGNINFVATNQNTYSIAMGANTAYAAFAPANRNKWSTFAFRVANNGHGNAYLNGSLLTTLTNTGSAITPFSSTNNAIGYEGIFFNRSGMGLQYLYVYDGQLNDTDLAAVTNAMMTNGSVPSVTISPYFKMDPSDIQLVNYGLYSYTNNNCVCTNNTVKFGNSALYTTNSSLANKNNLIINTLPNTPSVWTVETFVNAVSLNRLQSPLFSTVSNGFKLTANNNGKLTLSVSTDGSTFTSAQSATNNIVSLSTWYHVALVYNGTVYTVFVNGSSVISLTAGSIGSNAFNSLCIGSDSSSYSDMYYDELRISNTARYSASFTPTATRFNGDTNTILLHHFDTDLGKLSNLMESTSVSQTSSYTYNNMNGFTSSVDNAKFGFSSGYFNNSYFTITDIPSGSVSNTLEFWLKLNTLASGIIFTTSIYGLKLDINSSGTLGLSATTNSSAWDLTNQSSTNMTTNTWNHIAITSTGGTIVLYLNGTSVASVANAIVSIASLTFGYDANSLSYISGYIDELRLSSTVRYSSTFTPAASAFTRDASTILLNHFDIPSSQYDISSSDDVDLGLTRKTSNISPSYTWTSSGAKISCLNYKFGVSSLSLLRSNNAFASIQSGPNTPSQWTLSFWMNPTDLSIDSTIVSNVNGLFDITLTSSGYISVSTGSSSAGDIVNNQTSTNTIAVNVWSHIAVVYTGSDYNLYVNGTKTAIGIASNNIGSSVFNNLYIGKSNIMSNRLFNGFIDEFMISNDVKYTTTFIPKEVASIRDSSMLILNHFNGNDLSVNLNDCEDTNSYALSQASGPSWTTFGSSSTSTNAFMFGESSLLCDRTNNSYARLTGLSTTIEDFCIESWVYLKSNGATYSTIFSANANFVFQLVIDHTNSNKLGFYLGNGSSWSQYSNTLTSAAISIETWNHIAISYSMMEGWKIFINGTLDSNLAKRFITYMSTINIGSNFVWSSDSSKNFDGYIDEFRVSNCARYTQTFPAPIAPFYRDTSTLSLNHFNSSVAEDTTMYGKLGCSWNLNTNMIEKTAARFNSPTDIVMDSIGNLYVLDSSNNIIRKIDTEGNVSTPFNFIFNDLTNAGSFYSSMCIDSNDNLYVNDYVSSTNTVYKITISNGNVYKLFGGGVNNINTLPSSATLTSSATLHIPGDVAFDSFGDMYILETSNGAVRKLFRSSNMIITFAQGFSGLKGIAIDSNNNVFVSNANNIYKINTSGRFTVYAGTNSSIGGPTYTYGAPVEGHASSVYFSSITGIAFDSSGNLFVCDTGYNMIRKIDSSGHVSNFAGNRNASTSTFIGGYRTNVQVSPSYCAFDSIGNMYVTESSYNRVKKITPDGMVSIFIGSAGTSSSTNGSTLANSTVSNPLGIKVDSSDSIYIIESNGIRKITSGGTISTLVATSTFTNASGLGYLQSTGLLYVCESGKISTINSSGTKTTLIGSTSNATIVNNDINCVFRAVAVDSANTLYVMETSQGKIIKYTSSGVLTTINTDGNFTDIVKMVVSSDGYLYGVTPFNQKVSRFNLSTETTSTFSNAVNLPTGIKIDASNNIYVADKGVGLVKKFDLSATVSTYASITNVVSLCMAPSGTIYTVSSSGAGAIKSINTSQVVTTITGSATAGYIDVGRKNEVQSSVVKFDSGALAFYGNINTPTVSNVAVSSINNWTIEFWLYSTGGISNKSSINRYILTSTAASKSNFGALGLYLNSSNQLNLNLSNGTSWNVTSLNSGNSFVVENKWNHISISKNGNAYYLYLNGIGFTTSNSTNVDPYVFTQFKFGGWDGSTTSGLSGYIDGFRVSTVARNAIPNTFYSGVLIEPPICDEYTVCLNNFNCVGSSNLFDSNDLLQFPNEISNFVAIGGNIDSNKYPTISTTTSKFGSSSLSFNGSQMCAVVTNNKYLTSTNNFTIEFWAYLSSGQYGQCLLSNSMFDAHTFTLYIGRSTLVLGVGTFNNGSYSTINNLNTGRFIESAWNHIAVVYSSEMNSIRVYINGIATSFQVGSINFRYLVLGGLSDPSYNGYIDEFRFSNISRYLTNFTPQTSEFVNDNFTISLNHFNGPNGSKKLTMCQDINYNLINTKTSLGINSNNLVTIDKSLKKFGTASGYFVGGGNIAISNLVNIVKPWTIETYVYPRSFLNGQPIFGSFGTNSIGSNGLTLNSNSLSLTLNNSTVSIAASTTGGSIVYHHASSWNHVVLQNDGIGSISVYVNGLLASTTTYNTLRLPSEFFSTLVLGYNTNGSAFGYFDNFRVSNIARYPSSFNVLNTDFIKDSYTLGLNGFNGSSSTLMLTADDDVNGVTWSTKEVMKPTAPVTQLFGNSTYSVIKDSTTVTGLSNLINVITAQPDSWTIDFWMYLSQFNSVFRNTPIISSNGISIQAKYPEGIILTTPTGNVYNISTTFTLSKWSHVALVFTGSVYNLYLDGVNVISYASNVSTGALSSILIGSSSTITTNAPLHISDFRISNTVKYASNFSVPTSVSTVDSNTISLNSFRSTAFATGEIGLRTGLYNGGFYYNKAYCVYLVASTISSLPPAYFVSDRNLANGDRMFTVPTNYSTSSYRQLPFYMSSENNTNNELFMRKYYSMKNICVITTANNALTYQTASGGTTSFGINNSSIMPLHINKYRLALNTTDQSPFGALIRVSDNSEYNYNQVYNEMFTSGPVNTFQYVDTPQINGTSTISFVGATGSTYPNTTIAGTPAAFYM